MRSADDLFVYNCWYAAAWDHEVAERGLLARTFLELPVVIYRGENGQYVALEDRCCHRAAPLSMGRIEGDCVRCMYHGMKFGPDGRCVEIPGQDRISDSHRVRALPCVEKGHLLWLWMGDPERADPDDILDFAPLTEPGWTGLTPPDYLHYQANWLLIVDNLSDFSHLAFVHTNTLGGSEDYAFSTAQEIEPMERGFGFTRWHRDSAPPPYHKKVSPEGDARVDRRNTVTMQYPGIFFMETAFAPPGTDMDAGEAGRVRQYRNCQYMTPETRSTSHFFWNYLRDFRHDEPAVTASLRESLLEGFMEDKVLIEAQQQRLEIDAPFQPRFLQADAGLSQFRQGWQRLLEAERNDERHDQPAVVRNPIL